MIDEFSSKYLIIHCAKIIRSPQVIEEVLKTMITYGIPEYIQSDSGRNFIAKALRRSGYLELE